MAKLWLIIAAALAATCLLIGRTESLPRADLVYVNSSGIHTLDPARMSWTPDFRVALNIWEGLTTWDPKTNELIGAAAEYPPHVSDDGLTYQFTIRDDARWSNGDPVTSLDFVRGWRRAMEPGSAADYSFLFSKHIAGAAAYVRWRREGVSVLTALSRLCDSGALTDEQNHELESASSLRPFVPIGRNSVKSRQSDESISDQSSPFAPTLLEPSQWCEVRSEYFHAHVAEMDYRFLGVGLETPDARTLIVHLTSPCPYIADLLGLPTFVPCHVSIERLRIRDGASPITRQGLVIYDPQWTKPDYHSFGYPGLITNGAYGLESWTFKRSLRMQANPYYRRADAIELRTVEMRVYENINAALMAYAAGDVDFLPSMSVPYDYEIARLARSGQRPDFQLCHVMATYYLLFNCADMTIDGEPNLFVDSEVRRAFAMALDKSVLVNNVLARGDRVAHSLVPPGIAPDYAPPRAPEQDAEAARTLLHARLTLLGISAQSIDLLCTQRDQRVLQSIARQWEQVLGVEVSLRVLETKTFAQEKTDRRFMIATGNWYADYFDPTTFLDCYISASGNNDGGYRNVDYDSSLARAERETDARARLELLAQAESVLIRDDVALIPILHYGEPIAIAPGVEGLLPNARMWFPFQRVSRR